MFRKSYGYATVYARPVEKCRAGPELQRAQERSARACYLPAVPVAVPGCAVALTVPRAESASFYYGLVS